MSWLSHKNCDSSNWSITTLLILYENMLTELTLIKRNTHLGSESWVWILTGAIFWIHRVRGKPRSCRRYRAKQSIGRILSPNRHQLSCASWHVNMSRYQFHTNLWIMSVILASDHLARVWGAKFAWIQIALVQNPNSSGLNGLVVCGRL